MLYKFYQAEHLYLNSDWRAVLQAMQQSFFELSKCIKFEEEQVSEINICPMQIYD